MKKVASILCMGILLCLSACSADTVKKEEQRSVNISSTEDYQQDEYTAVVNGLQELAKGKGIIDIRSAGEGVVMAVLSEEGMTNCYFWSVDKKSVISCWEDVEIVGNVYFQSNKGGFVLHSLGRAAYLGDTEYHLQQCLTLPENLIGATGICNYCVLPEKGQFIFYEEELTETEFFVGLYSMELSGGNKKLICKLEDPQKSIGELNAFNCLYASYQEDCIYFTGNYFLSSETGAKGQPCIGRILLSDQSILVQKVEKQEALILPESVIFYDGLLEPGQSSGEIIRMNKNGEVFYIETGEKEESQSLILSDEKKFYISYYELDGFTHIVFYSVDTNKEIKNVQVPDYLLSLCVIEQCELLIGTVYNEGTGAIELFCQKY